METAGKLKYTAATALRLHISQNSLHLITVVKFEQAAATLGTIRVSQVSPVQTLTQLLCCRFVLGYEG